jgi:hypothetical protein
MRHYPTERDRIRASAGLGVRESSSVHHSVRATAARAFSIAPDPDQRTTAIIRRNPTTQRPAHGRLPLRRSCGGEGRGEVGLFFPTTGHLPLGRNIRRNPTEPVPAIDFGLPTSNEKLQTRNFRRGTPTASASRNTQYAIRNFFKLSKSQGGRAHTPFPFRLGNLPPLSRHSVLATADRRATIGATGEIIAHRNSKRKLFLPQSKIRRVAQATCLSRRATCPAERPAF